MLNFHKFGFLDAKKLQRYTKGNDFWLETLNPNWLFIWSDTYKPEIAYDESFAYIRLYIEEVGICYYPPLGDGNMKRALRLLREDAETLGNEFNMTSFDERLSYRFKEHKLELKENEEKQSFIYTLDDIAFMKKKSSAKQFEKEHKGALYREIKKEDFPVLLEFIANWSKDEQIRMDKEYFDRLNSIKKIMEHLYEFDFIGVMLYDEEHIYGVGIASIMDNMAFVHMALALSTVVGALEELMICFCKRVSIEARYINLGNIKMETVNPFKIEKQYSTYRL